MNHRDPVAASLLAGSMVLDPLADARGYMLSPHTWLNCRKRHAELTPKNSRSRRRVLLRSLQRETCATVGAKKKPGIRDTGLSAIEIENWFGCHTRNDSTHSDGRSPANLLAAN